MIPLRRSNRRRPVGPVRVRPAPELVWSAPWQVESWAFGSKGRPCVSLAGKIIRVPTDPSAQAVEIRQHEMAHIRYSPETLVDLYGRGLRPELMHTAEEVRVETRFKLQTGIPHPTMTAEREHDAGEFQLVPDWQTDPMTRWQAALASLASKDGTALPWSSLETRVIDSAVDLLCRLAKRQHEADDLAPAPCPNVRIPQTQGAVNKARLALVAFQLVFAPGRPNPKTDSPIPEASRKPARWLPWTLVDCPRTVRVPQAWNRRYRSRDTGTVPTMMARYCTDQAIFRETVKLPGGSVLLDWSGSMGLRESQVTRLLTEFPAATIAAYCASSSRGELYLLAKNGMRVPRLPQKINDGNGIDGPALEWLGHQDEPRTWVSDGGVHGVDCTVMHLAECQAALRKYGIRQVGTIEDAVGEDERRTT